MLTDERAQVSDGKHSVDFQRPSIDIIRQLIAHSRWGSRLGAEDLERVGNASTMRHVSAGQTAIRCGDAADHWIGVNSGLLMQSVAGDDGKKTVISVAADGAWFGEGTLLKNERWRYEVAALRRSVLVLVPCEEFERLRQTSIAFNHYLAEVLNDRLGLFVGMLLSDRLHPPDVRLARNLVAMAAAEVYGQKYVGILPVTQSILALLSGLSRQRTNEGIQRLRKLGLIRVNGIGVEILRLDELERFSG